MLKKKLIHNAIAVLQSLVLTDGMESLPEDQLGQQKSLLAVYKKLIMDLPDNAPGISRIPYDIKDIYKDYGFTQNNAYEKGLIKLSVDALKKQVEFNGSSKVIMENFNNWRDYTLIGMARDVGNRKVYKYHKSLDHYESFLFKYEPAKWHEPIRDITVYGLFATILEWADKLKRDNEQDKNFLKNYEVIKKVLTDRAKWIEKEIERDKQESQEWDAQSSHNDDELMSRSREQ